MFSLIFVLLALSLFGFYELQLPQSWQNKLANISNKQKSGSYLGVAIMGVLATLIVSPCVTPPLVGALGYISTTGNSLLGGLALFTLGLGMGVPLLIIGTAGGKLLPTSGMWMNAVKSFFGVLLLGVAIWMLSRILPGPVTLILWSTLLIGSASFLGVFTQAHTQWQKLWKGLGLVMINYSTVL